MSTVPPASPWPSSPSRHFRRHRGVPRLLHGHVGRSPGNRREASPPAASARPMNRRCPKRHEDMDVAKVLSHMCMSLDGFIAQPDDNPAELFEWYWAGEVVLPSAQETMSFSVDAASAGMLRELISGCGAVVAGRRLFDQSDVWGDNHPAGAPEVVLT